MLGPDQLYEGKDMIATETDQLKQRKETNTNV